MSRLHATLCPFCGQEHEVSTEARPSQKSSSAPEATMRPGDITLCIYCGEFSVMGDDDMLRKPNFYETVELNTDPQMVALRRAWESIKGKRL